MGVWLVGSSAFCQAVSEKLSTLTSDTAAPQYDTLEPSESVCSSSSCLPKTLSSKSQVADVGKENVAETQALKNDSSGGTICPARTDARRVTENGVRRPAKLSRARDVILEILDE